MMSENPSKIGYEIIQTIGVLSESGTWKKELNIVQWGDNIAKYDIRTWNFRPAKKDKKGQTCAEIVEYTLFKMVADEHGSHGEEVDEGCLRIEWTNN